MLDGNAAGDTYGGAIGSERPLGRLLLELFLPKQEKRNTTYIKKLPMFCNMGSHFN